MSEPPYITKYPQRLPPGPDVRPYIGGVLLYLLVVLVPLLLRLTRLVAWPWKWVTAPLWAPWGLLLVLSLLGWLKERRARG